MELSEDNAKSQIYTTDTGRLLTIKTSYIVELHEQLSLRTSIADEINLDVTIIADFKNIPEEYHETFIHIMSARYGGVVKAYSNAKPFDLPISVSPKWWEFWKKLKI
jgi:hypothetical protein